MSDNAKKYRFLLIQAFHLPPTSKHLHRSVEGPKEQCLMNPYISVSEVVSLRGICRVAWTFD